MFALPIIIFCTTECISVFSNLLWIIYFQKLKLQFFSGMTNNSPFQNNFSYIKDSFIIFYCI